LGNFSNGVNRIKGKDFVKFGYSITMVCLVHDRRNISQFHATVNKLRNTKQFSVTTLRELPRKCCSCTDKSKPLVESLDFDVLQMICLELDFERCPGQEIKSSTSEMQNYSILSFANVPPTINRISLAMEFLSQRIRCVSLNFITSGSSIELLRTAIQYQHDLVNQCSNYTEVQQNVNGLWVIITGNNKMEIDAMKSTVENDWKLFIEHVITRTRFTMYRAPQNCFPLLTTNQCLRSYRSRIVQDKRLKKKTARVPAQEKLQQKQQRMVSYFSDENEDVLANLNQCLHYLLGKYENSNKKKRSRIHRRQHMLALELFA